MRRSGGGAEGTTTEATILHVGPHSETPKALKHETVHLLGRHTGASSAIQSMSASLIGSMFRPLTYLAESRSMQLSLVTSCPV